MSNIVVKYKLGESGSTAIEGVSISQAKLDAKIEAGDNDLTNEGGAASVSNVCHDFSGNMYVTDPQNHVILRVTEGGDVSVFAGFPGVSGDLQDVSVENSSGNTRAAFNAPRGIACDKSGNVFVCDSGNNKIKVIEGGSIRLVAGEETGFVDGVGGTARFDDPRDIAVDNYGTLYVTDNGNHAVRKITSGTVLTIAGNGSSGNANNVKANKFTATFNDPRGIAVDAQGVVYVADTGNLILKKITPNGWVYRFSGGGNSGRSLGTAPEYPFNCSYESPIACDVDESGNLYVLDFETDTSRLLKLDYSGRPSVVVDFSLTTEAGDVSDVACTPGQKILVVH